MRNPKEMDSMDKASKGKERQSPCMLVSILLHSIHRTLRLKKGNNKKQRIISKQMIFYYIGY